MTLPFDWELAECPTCGAIFKNDAAFDEHLVTDTKDGSIACGRRRGLADPAQAKKVFSDQHFSL